MTTVQINLPDQLAQEAQRAGLLTSAALERMLREYLKTRKTDELFAAMDRMAAVEVPAMTPEEISEELHAMRAARRQSR
jgi:Arc/MetJ family transcription regulator